jgi:hypothetical protein
MSCHLDDFYALVRSSHAADGSSCHWTPFDEVTSPTQVARIKGPCGCGADGSPQRRPVTGGAGCAGAGCAKTEEVLGTAIPIEAHYGKLLDEIEEDLGVISPAIRRAEDIIDHYVGQRPPGQLEEDAARDAVRGTLLAHPLKAEMHAHWDDGMCRRIERILNVKTRLPLAQERPSGRLCDCLVNKVARLNAEKLEYARLQSAAAHLSAELRPLVEQAAPDFTPARIAAMQGPLRVAPPFMRSEPLKLGHDIEELLTYIRHDTDQGGRIYVLLRAVERVAQQKIGAMIAAIYHDKQAHAPSCQEAPS